MRIRTKLALSATLLVITVPLSASSCQSIAASPAAVNALHFDIAKMGIVPGTAEERPPNTFRLTAGPAKRTLQVTLQSRSNGADGFTVPQQPEFCTLDLGGRMDIAFVQLEGDTYVGQVSTPTSFEAGKSVRGSLRCDIGGIPKTDQFTVVIVK